MSYIPKKFERLQVIPNAQADKARTRNQIALLEAIVPDFDPDSEQVRYIASMTNALQCYARARLGQIELPQRVAERHVKQAKALRAITPGQGPDRKQMERDFPESAGYVALLEACLAQYTQILAGEVNPLTVMFPGGSFELFESIYRGNPPADYFNQIVADVVARFVNRHSGRRLHLLEVGAGTGSTTQFVLPRLRQHEAVYTFTDISLAFLNKARARFTEFPFVRYEICDIERSDVGKQKYEVIIASNVIHATADLLATIHNIRQWLVPGGVLILNEITNCQDYMTITFGLIEGWWRSVDPYRTNGPLISASTWQSLLHDAGFTAVKGHGSANQQVLVAYFEGNPGCPSAAIPDSVPIPGTER